MTLSLLAFSLTTFPWSLQCLLVRPPLLSCHQALSFTSLDLCRLLYSVGHLFPFLLGLWFLLSVGLCPSFTSLLDEQVHRGADVKSRVSLLNCSVIDIPGKGPHLKGGSYRLLLTASSPGAASGKSAGF